MVRPENVKIDIRKIFVMDDHIRKADFKWDRSGIRTQLINKSDKKFVPDFMIEQRANHTHLLNFASPGWTSAFSTAERVTSMLT